MLRQSLLVTSVGKKDNGGTTDRVVRRLESWGLGLGGRPMGNLGGTCGKHLSDSFAIALLAGPGDEVCETDVQFVLLGWRQFLELAQASHFERPIALF